MTIPSKIDGKYVTSIGASAFKRKNIYNLIFEDTPEKPSRLSKIGNSAFANNWLTNVEIPLNVSTIGDDAFNENPNLTTITIKKADSSGITLGANWNGSATVVYDPS